MTPSELQHQAVWDNLVRAISEIPTGKAMLELDKCKAYLPTTRKAVESMAANKDVITKSLRLMQIRINYMQLKINMLEASNKTDKLIAATLAETGDNYEIVKK